MKENICPGCWIETIWGPAVCTEVKTAIKFDTKEVGIFINYRYKAYRINYSKSEKGRIERRAIWVSNGDFIEYVSYVGEQTGLSKQISKLESAYPHLRKI